MNIYLHIQKIYNHVERGIETKHISKKYSCIYYNIGIEAQLAKYRWAIDMMHAWVRKTPETAVPIETKFALEGPW